MGWFGRMLAACTLVLGGITGEAVPGQAQPLVLGSGPELGTYRPVGVALKLLLEQTGGPVIAVETTAGSVANLEGLRAGRYGFALAQGDLLEDAFAGAGAFAAKGADTDLRAVMELHEEALALVVRPGARVRGVADLAGRTVDLGAPGSGGRPLAERLVSGLPGGAVKPVGMNFGQAAAALCAKKIDAAFLFVGHPSAVLVDALSRCNGRLVPIEGPAVDALVQSMPPLRRTTIPGHAYANVRRPVPTVGVPALLVTRANASDDSVTAILTAVHRNRDLFRQLHPALFALPDRPLKPEQVTVPLHPAAQRFFAAEAAR